MNKNRQRILLGIMTLMLLVFAGCKGESPTAPAPNPPAGGNTPPVGAAVTLTASNPTPALSGTSVITATVTQNGQPVPNGTAVEFSTTFGSFSGVGGQAVIQTTLNGVASVTLTSGAAGPAVVTAVVNNISRQVTVTFQPAPVVPTTPPPNTAPSIVSVFPLSGRPEGGQTITITGTNFKAPMRVIFDFGLGVVKEAFVVPGTLTATSVQVITPSIDLGRDTNGLLVQSKEATVSVFTEVGTPNELKATSATPFTYLLTVLTPRVTTMSPATGPLAGGTRVTIFGDGFQSPLKLSFGSIQGNTWFDVQVINVTLTQIIAITPPGRDLGNVLAGPIDIRVINISSASSVEIDNAFVYTPEMIITTTGPSSGPIFGGTRVTIDGNGFDDPVAVTIAGIAAQVIRVSGSQIIAVTSAVLATGTCAGPTGGITVTNVNTGESAIGGAFTYIAPRPLIVSSLRSTEIAGANITVGVLNALPGITRFTIGGRPVFPTSSTTNATTGITAYIVPIPTTLTFAPTACTVNGSAGTTSVPLISSVVYTNVDFGCSNTLDQGLTIFPVGTVEAPAGTFTPPCVVPPSATVTPASPTCAVAAPAGQTATGVATASGTFTIANNSGTTQTLQIRNGAATGTNTTTVSVNPTSVDIGPGASVTFTITMDPAAAGPFQGTATFTTNAPGQAAVTACVSGTAVP